MSESGNCETIDSTCSYDVEDHRYPSRPSRYACGGKQDFPVIYSGGTSSFRCCRCISFTFLSVFIYDCTAIFSHSYEQLHLGIVFHVYVRIICHLHTMGRRVVVRGRLRINGSSGCGSRSKWNWNPVSVPTVFKGLTTLVLVSLGTLAMVSVSFLQD